jgi:hypothetical protein
MARDRRHLGFGIVGGVLAVCLLVALLAVLVRPADADGYGPEAESQVVGFCERSAPDVDAPDSDDEEDACRCAYEHLVATVPWDRFIEMDEALRSGGGEIPPELADALRACGAVPA